MKLLLIVSSIFHFYTILGFVIKFDEEANIIGGNDITINNVPYQVSLQINGEHSCGGAIISNMHVLTAAHCTIDIDERDYANVKIITGTSSLAFGGQLHNIQYINIHPDFSQENSLKNDISIITLFVPMIFNNFQSPIELPNSQTNDFSNGIITGWGVTAESNTILSTVLKVLSVIILTHNQCQRCHDDRIYAEHICGFSGSGNGFGTGDSGSPLVVNRKLVGIASWTRPSSMGLADVYTRVSYFRRYIDEKIT